jgi:hypothetical protein
MTGADGPGRVEVVITDDLAGQLLRGPRGRRLLSAVVGEATEGTEPWIWPAWGHDDGAPLDDVLEELQRRLGRAVAAVDLDAVSARRDPRDLWSPLADAVCSARYWQHPDVEDRALAEEAVASLLRPVAQAVAASEAASWWSQPVDLDAQQQLSWLYEGRDPYVPVVAGQQGEALARWREEAAADEERCRVERPKDVGANWTGTWWSSPPQLPELLVTTPVLPGELPVGMTMLEDDLGLEEVLARPVRLRAGLRVHEIHDAQAWCDLVAAHPRSVTFSRRHDWWRSTGWDGAWALPDWASVATAWDGVHLSGRGYLAVSGRLLETSAPGAARTLLAGWSPVQTHWLTDVVEEVGEPVRWVSREDDHPLRWSRQT